MTIDPWSVMTGHQAATAQAWLAERARERRHLVIYLSGAHAYGFPSPDSDLDLKCVHVAPTGALLGLQPPGDSVERTAIVDGVELDYSSHELAHVLRGIVKGNGNYLERLLGDLVLGGDAALLESIRPVVRGLLSRRVGRHYGGFATSQLKLFDQKPTAKRALYVLRTCATGRALLVRGVLETDVARLGEFVPRELDELLAIKRQAEKQPLDAAAVEAWRPRLVDAIAAIDASPSLLPPEPTDDALAAADAWLVDTRRASF